jgi:uncharacterized protein
VIIFDVNVFLFAMDEAARHHALATQTLARALTGAQPVGIIDETLAAVVRISTNPRIQPSAATSARAVSFCEQIRAAPATESTRPGATAWSHFTTMVTALELRGNDITDAWLAAQAIELDAHFVTFDRGFQRPRPPRHGPRLAATG